MEKTSVIQQIKLNNIIYPILIGLGVIAYMLYSDIDADKLRLTQLDNPKAQGWYDYQINEAQTQVNIEITDTLLLKKDSVKIVLSYWAGKINKTRFYKDTLSLAVHGDGNYSFGSPLQKISCQPGGKFQFNFNQTLRNVLSGLNITAYSLFFLFIAFSMMVVRDLGYTWRIRILTDKQLSWISALKVILLWEFTSALTPSAVGGSAVAILLLSKEGISIGKSTAVVMATIFLDEMYFLIFVPFMFFVVGGDRLFAINALSQGASMLNEFFYFTVIGYSVIFVFTAFLAYGLFFNPRGLKWLIIKVFRIKWLRRWLYDAAETGNEIIISSKELLKKNKAFWLKSSFGTFFSWTARYWIVNFLLLAFFTVNDHLLIFARQLVMWIMMIVSPTPGGSGFSEYVFATYLGQFIPSGLETALALIWRLITYYPYLIIGAFLFPRWVKSKFGKNFLMRK